MKDVRVTLDDDEYALLVRVAEAEDRTITRQALHYVRARLWSDARRLWPREYRGSGWGPAHTAKHRAEQDDL
jgi:hypothetical protein